MLIVSRLGQEVCRGAGNIGVTVARVSDPQGVWPAHDLQVPLLAEVALVA